MKDRVVENYNWTISGSCNCPVCSGSLGVNITAYQYKTGRKAKRPKACTCEISWLTDEQKQVLVEAVQKAIEEGIRMF